MLRQEPGDVGAEPEEGRMAERDDARIAEDEVEREREQAEDGDLVEDEVAGSGSRKRVAAASEPEQRSRPDVQRPARECGAIRGRGPAIGACSLISAPARTGLAGAG